MTTTGPLDVTRVPRSASPGRRLLSSVTVGLGGSILLALTDLGWQFVLLGGWVITASLFLVHTWWSVGRLDAAETQRRATQEDDTRTETGLVLVTASLASLIGVAFGLVEASKRTQVSEVSLTVLCVLGIALSWAVVHTVFTLRYANEYCAEGGGIEFGSDAPTYADFAYFAFTVGMTYQVSDTGVTSRRIRRSVLRHALLSFLFGTVIVAVTINVVAGFVQR